MARKKKQPVEAPKIEYVPANFFELYVDEARMRALAQMLLSEREGQRVVYTAAQLEQADAQFGNTMLRMGVDADLNFVAELVPEVEGLRKEVLYIEQEGVATVS